MVFAFAQGTKVVSQGVLRAESEEDCRPLRCPKYEWACHQDTGTQLRNSPNSGWVAHDCGKKHWGTERGPK